MMHSFIRMKQVFSDRPAVPRRRSSEQLLLDVVLTRLVNEFIGASTGTPVDDAVSIQACFSPTTFETATMTLCLDRFSRQEPTDGFRRTANTLTQRSDLVKQTDNYTFHLLSEHLSGR